MDIMSDLLRPLRKFQEFCGNLPDVVRIELWSSIGDGIYPQDPIALSENSHDMLFTKGIPTPVISEANNVSSRDHDAGTGSS